MGMFAFKRMREQEAAKSVASVQPTKKRKRKPKTNGSNDTHNSRKQHSQ
jgi:hypothetical protein